jgi:hypothetical protein
VCLLFLAKCGANKSRFVRADNLQQWLSTFRGIEAEIPANRVTGAEWNFAVGKDLALFEKLNGMSVKLGELADRISQGIRTSANEVYVLDVVSENDEFITARSKHLEREVVIERKAVLNFLQGREIKAYSIVSSGKVVVMPYSLTEGRMILESAKKYRESWPKAWDYLCANRKYLEAREGGRMKHDGWYGFIYPKNLDIMFAQKLLVPDISDRAAFAFDDRGHFAFTSGYGITFKSQMKESPKFVLGLLNSNLLNWYWKRVSTPLRGGYYRYFKQFIEQLPIATASPEQKKTMERLVDRVLAAKQRDAEADVSALEREMNQLVYALYGLTPEEIQTVEGVAK